MAKLKNEERKIYNNNELMTCCNKILTFNGCFVRNKNSGVSVCSICKNVHHVPSTCILEDMRVYLING
jgi:hypothetical protein